MNDPSNPLAEPIDAAPERVAEFERGDVSWKSCTDQWNANHGTLLMAFAASVFLVGAGILAYQQSRSRLPIVAAGRSTNQPVSAEELAAAASDDSPEAIGDQPAVGVRVRGVSDAGGAVRVAVYNAAEHFNEPEHADWKRKVEFDESGVAQCQIPLEVLEDRFAIAVYHDANGNGQLDRNLLGVPTEPYGFSNTARGQTGPPGFEQAAIERPVAGSILEIELE